MSELLLIVHVLSAAAWIGGSAMFGFVGPRMGKAGGPAAGAWLGVVLEAMSRFFIPVILLTLLSGLSIVVVAEDWTIADPFVGIGIASVVAAAGVAFFNNRPAVLAAIDAAQRGDGPAIAANARKLVSGGSWILAILIATEVVMVLRLGA